MGEGEPVGGFKWLCCWMVGWLACTEVLVMHEIGCPICVEAGTFQGFCLMGVLYMDGHGLLDGPGLAVNFLVHYTELVGVHGMACGGAV